MKNISRLLFIIVLITSMNFNLFSQSENSGSTFVSNMTIGVKAGYSHGSFAENYMDRFTSYRTGYYAGISVSYYVLDWIAVNTEILYMEHGADNIPPTILYLPGSAILIDLERTDVEMRKLDIPILANIHIPGMSGNIQPKLIIGGNIGYNFQTIAFNKRITGLNESVVISKIDVSDRFSDLDYGLTAGFGINLKSGSMIISLEGRYRMGLSNVHNMENSEAFTTNILQFSLGVGF